MKNKSHFFVPSEHWIATAFQKCEILSHPLALLLFSVPDLQHRITYNLCHQSQLDMNNKLECRLAFGQ